MIENKIKDILVLCLGANDMLRNIKPSLIKQNLTKLKNRLQKEKITILLVSMLSQETLGKEYKQNFVKIYPELAKTFKIPLLPFLLKGIALNSEYNLEDGKHNYEIILSIFWYLNDIWLFKFLIHKPKKFYFKFINFISDN